MILFGHVGLNYYDDVRLLKWGYMMQCVCIYPTLLRKLNGDMLIRDRYYLNDMTHLGFLHKNKAMKFYKIIKS